MIEYAVLTEKRTIILAHPEARSNAHKAIDEAPQGHVVTIKPPGRNLEQNALFHSICSDLAKSELKWMGKKRTAEEWKTLIVSGHSVATKEGAEMVPGIEGEFLNLRESTARMSKKRASSLIDYASSFLAQNGL